MSHEINDECDEEIKDAIEEMMLEIEDAVERCLNIILDKGKIEYIQHIIESAKQVVDSEKRCQEVVVELKTKKKRR